MKKNNSLSAQIESLLAAKLEPISISRLADVLDSKTEDVQRAVASLKKSLQENRGLSLIQNENRIQLVTDPENSDIIAKQKEQEIDTNLTKAQSEALAVIAYMAPVAKPTIDFVRGVNSRAVLRNLATRGLIKKDRSHEKVEFSLSSEALQHLGVTNVQELPKYEQTRKKLAEFVEANQTSN